MNKTALVRRLSVLRLTCALVVAGCASEVVTTAGSGGSVTTGSGGAPTGTGGMAGGSGGTNGGTGGISGGTGGMKAGTGGLANGSGGTAGGGAPTATPDLIGPGGATCGNPNATHDDGWICILSYPGAGANVVGAWFGYAWTNGKCTYALTKPSGTTRKICFSGGSCSGAQPVVGLGFSICDVHGVNVATWPQMQQLISTHNLSTTGKSTFTACNTGKKATKVAWTMASGTIPAGTSVAFQDAADQTLGMVNDLAAGATSADVPASIDATKIASIHFLFNGLTVPSWNFCLATVNIWYQ